MPTFSRAFLAAAISASTASSCARLAFERAEARGLRKEAFRLRVARGEILRTGGRDERERDEQGAKELQCFKLDTQMQTLRGTILPFEAAAPAPH